MGTTNTILGGHLNAWDTSFQQPQQNYILLCVRSIDRLRKVGLLPYQRLHI